MKMMMSLLPLFLNLSKMKTGGDQTDPVTLDMVTEVITRQIRSLWVVLVFSIFSAGLLLFCAARVLLITEVYVSQFVYGDLVVAVTYAFLMVAGSWLLYSYIKKGSPKSSDLGSAPQKKSQPADVSLDSILGKIGNPEGIVSDFVHGFQDGLARKENRLSGHEFFDAR